MCAKRKGSVSEVLKIVRNTPGNLAKYRCFVASSVTLDAGEKHQVHADKREFVSQLLASLPSVHGSELCQRQGAQNLFALLKDQFPCILKLRPGRLWLSFF